MAKRAARTVLRRERLSDQLAAELLNHIAEHRLKPGDSFLTEEAIVERFGVSRTVVREATKALDFLGIIRAAPRRGTVVEQFDFDRVAEYFGFHFALSDYPDEQLLKARAVVETGALYYAMAAMRDDPGVAEELMRRAEIVPDREDVDRRIEDDMAFHRALVEATKIAPLAAFCQLLQVFFRRFHERTAAGDFDMGHRQHRQIVEALRQGKLDVATEVLRAHLSWYEKE